MHDLSQKASKRCLFYILGSVGISYLWSSILCNFKLNGWLCDSPTVQPWISMTPFCVMGASEGSALGLTGSSSPAYSSTRLAGKSRWTAPLRSPFHLRERTKSTPSSLLTYIYFAEFCVVKFYFAIKIILFLMLVKYCGSRPKWHGIGQGRYDCQETNMH